MATARDRHYYTRGTRDACIVVAIPCGRHVLMQKTYAHPKVLLLLQTSALHVILVHMYNISQ